MKPLLILLGPTASGKTNLATRICSRLNGEIISADSRQIYRHMDIGTGKDLHEYVIDIHIVPYHLIDIRDAGEQYNVNEFQKDFKVAFDDISQRRATAVVCGGTGFYIHSLLTGQAFSSIPVNDPLRAALDSLDRTELLAIFDKYHSAYRERADTSTRKRLIRAIEISEFLRVHPEKNLAWANPQPGYTAVIYGLNPPVEKRRERISRRLHERLHNGLIEEVTSLLDSGLTPEQLIYYGLEYKYVTLYLTNQITYENMVVRLETEIHRFAKRQMTFFRKMERDGLEINWLETSETVEEQVRFVVDHYENQLKYFNKK